MINAQKNIKKYVEDTTNRLAALEAKLTMMEPRVSGIDERRHANELKKQADLVSLNAEYFCTRANLRQNFTSAESVIDPARPWHIDAKRDADLAELAVTHSEQIALNASNMLAAATKETEYVLTSDFTVLPRRRGDLVNAVPDCIDRGPGRKAKMLEQLDAAIGEFNDHAAQIERIKLERPTRKLSTPVHQLKIENDRGRRHAALQCFENSKAALNNLGKTLEAYRAAVAHDQTENPYTPAWQAITAEQWTCRLPGWQLAIQEQVSAATAESALVALYDGRKFEVDGAPGRGQRPAGNNAPVGAAIAVGSGLAPALDPVLTPESLAQSKVHITRMIQLSQRATDSHAGEAMLSITINLSNQLNSALHAADQYGKKVEKLEKEAKSIFTKVAWFERSRIAIERAELDRNVGHVRAHAATTARNIALMATLAEEQLVDSPVELGGGDGGRAQLRISPFGDLDPERVVPAAGQLPHFGPGSPGPLPPDMPPLVNPTPPIVVCDQPAQSSAASTPTQAEVKVLGFWSALECCRPDPKNAEPN